MTVHVLHAGDGYTYLTRQVASGDHQRRRGKALADYYAEAGNPPGRWVGTGLVSMGVDGQVSEAQMKALFGEGMHPDAEARIQDALSRGVDREAAVAAVRLGRRFPMIDQSHEVWRDRLNAAYAESETAHGHRPERGPERDLVRWNVAHDLFIENHEREPRDDAELKSFFAQVAKPGRQPVAGVDLVFTPVKSVSVLWALGDAQVRRDVELAHEAAWRRAFSYVEVHAARTRTGAAGGRGRARIADIGAVEKHREWCCRISGGTPPTCTYLAKAATPGVLSATLADIELASGLERPIGSRISWVVR